MAERTAHAMPTWADCGLLLAGHGSASHPDGALAINRIVRALRDENLFAEIEAGFLRQGPQLETMAEVFTTSHIYVVPVLASRGYIADTVIAKCLDIQGPTTIRKIGGKERTLLSCAPVGTHASIPALIAHRVAEVTTRHGLVPAETEILLVGHGTPRNKESSRRTREVADVLEKIGAAACVHAVFFDQEPRVDDWRRMVKRPSVLVVPFLMSSWFHGSQDLPTRIGLDPQDSGFRALVLNPGVAGPFTVGDQRIWHLSPVGNEPGLAETVVAVIRDFDAANRA